MVRVFLASMVSFLLCFSLFGCQPKKADPIIARWGSLSVTRSEFLSRWTWSGRKDNTLEAKKTFVQDVLNEKLLYQEALRKKIDQRADIRNQAEMINRHLVVAALLESEAERNLAQTKISTEEMESYYRVHASDWVTPEMARVSHILVASEEEAYEIRGALARGGDFETLAREKSLDHSGLQGGDLGYFERGKMVPEFESVVFSLKKGETSDVFKTPLGFHVAKLTDRIVPKALNFDSAKPFIEKHLQNEKKQIFFKKYIKELEYKSKISMDEKALEKI